MPDDPTVTEPLIERLRVIELFAELDDDQLAWLARVGRPVELLEGDVLFDDGEPARYFYVMLSGELLITKVLGGKEHVFSKHSAQIPTDRQLEEKPRAAHQYTGELPLLGGGTYISKATALGSTKLLAYDKETFLEMVARCPQICKVLLPVLAWRIRSYETLAGRNVMLEGLGTLAAGLAHELNNPTAVMVRAAGELRCTVRDLIDHAVRWGSLASGQELRLLSETRAKLLELSTGPGHHPRDELAAADAADLVVEWLTKHDIPRADEIGDILVEHGLDIDTLTELADGLRPEVIDAAVGCLGFSLHTTALVEEAVEAGRRVEALVGSTKSYTNLDRAPERDVDLREGLEATLAMQAPRLKEISIRRDYADVPTLAAYPSELNQVWTNLIDNAIDAMQGCGELRISTRLEGECAVVEIGDSGCGIPADILPQLFQPFFTTKDVGKGTGLGLHLSRDIVAHRHNGSIDVTSVPGDTRFMVRIPLRDRTRSL